MALDFTLVDLEGKSFRLSDYRGKVVIIDFMATLCDPCRVQVSHLGGVWEKYKDRVIIISIDLNPNETPEMLRDFSDQFPYATWIWAKDTENLGYKYGIVSIPTTIVIDQEGYVKARYVWITPNTVLIEEVERLLD